MATWLIIPLLAFFIFGRVFSYFRSSVPLGYDSGLYLHLFKEYSQIPFFSLPDWLIGMFPPGIPVLGKILSYFIPPEQFLVPLIIFFSCLLFFSVYFFSKKLWDKRVALWVTFIFCCSAIQYRVYWYYYLKNITAMAFLLFTFYFLLFNSYFAIPFAVLTAYTHRPTFFVLLVSLIAGLIFEKKKRRFYGIVLSSTLIIASFYYLPFFGKTLFPLIQPVIKSFIPQQFSGTLGTASGTFYEPWQALALALPYLPFALFGLKKQGLSKKNLILIAPLLAVFFIVFFRLFFFRRFIPFLDLFLILFAGYGLAHLSPPRCLFLSPRRWKTIFTGLYIGLLVIFASLFIYKTGKPLIYEDELQEIKMLSQVEPSAYILVTDQAYMPWAYGWSDRKVIAPGYGEYDIFWTIPEWHKFWESGDGEVEHNLLLKLPKPLYIFSGDHQPMYQFDFSGDCFQRINWRTFKFVCS